MNRNEYEQWLTNLVITLALVALGYWLGTRSHCPKAAVMPVPNVMDGTGELITQRQRNIKNSK